MTKIAFIILSQHLFTFSCSWLQNINFLLETQTWNTEPISVSHLHLNLISHTQQFLNLLIQTSFTFSSLSYTTIVKNCTAKTFQFSLGMNIILHIVFTLPNTLFNITLQSRSYSILWMRKIKLNNFNGLASATKLFRQKLNPNSILAATIACLHF